MDFDHFKTQMAKAKTFIDLHQNTDYWTGYQRGLRRAYHGETFGTEEEHAQWLAFVDDSGREDLGRGYRDGLKG